MILLNNLTLPLDTDFSNLTAFAAEALRVKPSELLSVTLFRKSVDARRKSDVHFCCSLLIALRSQEERVLKRIKNTVPYGKKPYDWPKADRLCSCRPIVVGLGPAGLFAALSLARAGLRPLVLERGQDADTRTQDVRRFLAGGALSEESNVQFGEGGAGTFSDGKLNTGIKDVRCRTVLESFAAHGAPQKILTEAKPHIGTDILTGVVKSIRKEIQSLGGEVRFGTRLEKLCVSGGKLTAVMAAGEEIPCETLILAAGHSARDTFELLREAGAALEKKPFAMGVRIEHLQADIDRALYGNFAGHPALGAADYKLAVHLENGRGVYTFCMCPGGEVINASSETGGIAVNGMSLSARNGKNANSALLVGVNPADFPEDDVLAGCRLQRKIEQAAYAVGQGAVPVTTVGSFCFGKPFALTRVMPTVKPRYCCGDLGRIYPPFMTESLKEGILLLDRRLPGFADEAAVLTAPETRSSSPVRVLRGVDGQSVSLKGLFPCGEGAGYAGGIVSAAVDGLKAAEAVIRQIGR